MERAPLFSMPSLFSPKWPKASPAESQEEHQGETGTRMPLLVTNTDGRQSDAHPVSCHSDATVGQDGPASFAGDRDGKPALTACKGSAFLKTEGP